MTDFPRRIRVKGGTVVHALTSERTLINGMGWKLPQASKTACRKEVDMGDSVTELNKAAPVSCKACARALSAKEA